MQATQCAPAAPTLVDVRAESNLTTSIDDALTIIENPPTIAENSPEIIESVTAPSGIYLSTKYVVERLVALLLVIVLAPLIAVVAICIRVTMGRGIVFRQERVGLNGSVFIIYKLRTMCHDRRAALMPVDADRRCTHKSTADPRHTAVGRFLRKTSIDELPQLVNVIRGDMTLIGPRPELATIVAERNLWHTPVISCGLGSQGCGRFRSSAIATSMSTWNSMWSMCNASRF